MLTTTTIVVFNSNCVLQIVLPIVTINVNSNICQNLWHKVSFLQYIRTSSIEVHYTLHNKRYQFLLFVSIIPIFFLKNLNIKIITGIKNKLK